MSEVVKSGGTSAEIEKPVQVDDVKFPRFPEPGDEDFDDDIPEEERSYYKTKFADLNDVVTLRLHCSSCDRHLGSSTRNESRMRAHPMLRTLVCHTCHNFYNSGEFEKGDDGSELYCRWCGQGGQVYCCSSCPHVFCAKCIKRNLGVSKIKEIENTDDWKCFKCSPKCLWDIRAVCWALLRYCDLKNKVTYKTEDQKLKEAYQKDCQRDYSECCKQKSSRRKEKIEIKNVRKDSEMIRKSVSNAIAKIPSAIQVKKFASINPDELSKEKKSLKRPASPQKHRPGILIRNPIPIATANQNLVNQMNMTPIKKMRMPMITSIRIGQDKKPPPVPPAFARIRPRPPVMPIPVIPSQYNGFGNNSFNNMVGSDNINLSLESLTQGLDMAAVVAMASNNNSSQDDDVVCTPDFPLEPLCEVTEDNNDDDVQCITPAPSSKIPTPPVISTRTGTTITDLSSENIIQMTENDVTVNTITGGLKFRVDPQTLSSNKMYRLPDGRIFAINANPSMPGGYSATIVSVAESGTATVPKGAVYAAKLSTSQSSTPAKRPLSIDTSTASSSRGKRSKDSITNRMIENSARKCDFEVPVEWYRYNLIDAVDALEYSLSRLNKLKREATTLFLRTRNIEEIKSLHRTLERLLNTSSTRFREIRCNLNRELKEYLTKKANDAESEDDDDDVEILPDLDDDDPIYIDENSMESTINDLCSESQEVDLTGIGSSDHNDSKENKNEDSKSTEGATNIEDNSDCDNNSNNSGKENSEIFENGAANPIENVHDDKIEESNDINLEDPGTSTVETSTTGPADAKTSVEQSENKNKIQLNGDTKTDNKDADDATIKKKCSKEEEQKNFLDELNNQDCDSKTQDSEMSDETIETLLKEDNPDEIDKLLACKAMDVAESV